MSQALHAGPASMGDALHAEWTKVRTVASTGWLLLAVIALTVAVSAAAATTTSCPSGDCALDAAKLRAGLGVLAAWATAALLAGGLLLRLRDA